MTILGVIACYAVYIAFIVGSLIIWLNGGKGGTVLFKIGIVNIIISIIIFIERNSMDFGRMSIQVNVLSSIAIGVAIYIVSTIIYNRYLSPIALKAIIYNNLEKWQIRRLGIAAWKCVYEELLWRFIPFNYGMPTVSVCVLCALFCAIHIRPRKMPLKTVWSTFLFSSVEYIVMYYTGSIINCILIHVTYNSCILRLQFITGTGRKKDESE